jgi:ubiquinone/menaquinone biosynthesis C-methylase UbiE
MPTPNAEGRIRTFNQMGAMNTTFGEFDYLIFNSINEDETVLDVGATFGQMSIEAVRRGADVTAVDLDERHKVATLNRTEPQAQKIKYVTGDFSSPAILDALGDKKFDHIILSRVFMYMTGDQIINSLNHASSLLHEGGKVYVLATTPFMNIFSFAKDEYEVAKNMGNLWPGYITSIHQKEPGLSSKIPDTYHMIDAKTLKRAAKKSGLSFTQEPTYSGIPYQSGEIECRGQEYVTAILSRP